MERDTDTTDVTGEETDTKRSSESEESEGLSTGDRDLFDLRKIQSYKFLLNKGRCKDKEFQQFHVNKYYTVIRYYK